MIGRTIAVDDTRFIFQTNFSGDPARDRFADARRKASLIIPDPEQAKDLIKAGFRVRETRPRQDDDPNKTADLTLDNAVDIEDLNLVINRLVSGVKPVKYNDLYPVPAIE